VARGSVVIVGGGIAGLSAAWELSGAAAGPNESTPRIELIEVSERLGGALVTTEFADRTIDLGADGFLARRPEGTALIRELGWFDQLEPIDASGASILLKGALYELPTGLAMGIPTSVAQVRRVRGLTWRARLAARRDQFFPTRLSVGDDISIGSIVRAKLGRELSYKFIEPMVGGIQAGRIDDLSAKSVFPPLYEAAARGGSLMKAMQPVTPAIAPSSESPSSAPLFYSLVHGLGALPIELARLLTLRGVVFRTGVAVTALRRTPSGSYPWEVDTATTTTPADVVIVATPAWVTGSLLGAHDPRLERLTRIDSASAAMVTFSVSREQITLPVNGTGILVPLGTAWSGEGAMMVTAVTLLDRKWPRLRRDDDVLVRVHVGRIDDDRWAALSDDELTLRVAKELSEILQRFGTPRVSIVQRWPNGLPQYRVGHATLVADAKEAAASMNLALCGVAYDGVGVPASIGSGRRAARETLAFLTASSDEFHGR
jgi:oxygen-dependent protoporphyrinogen oxidase